MRGMAVAAVGAGERTPPDFSRRRRASVLALGLGLSVVRQRMAATHSVPPSPKTQGYGNSMMMIRQSKRITAAAVTAVGAGVIREGRVRRSGGGSQQCRAVEGRLWGRSGSRRYHRRHAAQQLSLLLEVVARGGGAAAGRLEGAAAAVAAPL
eukprot:COSAG06_NODE_5328_length_3552_cov_5.076417_5_plen_152_part_00